MIKMSETSKAFLEKWLPQVLKSAESINDILDVLSDLMDYQGFNEDYSYNAFGVEAQRVYDDLYLRNPGR